MAAKNSKKYGSHPTKVINRRLRLRNRQRGVLHHGCCKGMKMPQPARRRTIATDCETPLRADADVLSRVHRARMLENQPRVAVCPLALAAILNPDAQCFSGDRTRRRSGLVSSHRDARRVVLPAGPVLKERWSTYFPSAVSRWNVIWKRYSCSAALALQNAQPEWTVPFKTAASALPACGNRAAMKAGSACSADVQHRIGLRRLRVDPDLFHRPPDPVTRREQDFQ